MCNIPLKGGPPEAGTVGTGSEEDLTKEALQARGFRSTFSTTAPAGQLWKAGKAPAQDPRSSTLLSAATARSLAMSAMDSEADQEHESAKAAQIERQSRHLFPMPIWQQNVQIIVPARPPHQMYSQEKSPFLLALNQGKLTPFQTMKAYEKTRKLIIQQGIGAKLNPRPLGPVQPQPPLKKRSFYGHRSLVAFPPHLAGPLRAPTPPAEQERPA